MSLDQLKIGLKTWEHEFESKYNRLPTKEDIKRLPDIKKMYKQYHMLKKQEVNTAIVTPSKENRSPEKPSKNVDEPTPNNKELGPTPQIYGKAISIFEMKLSPVKRSLTFEEQGQSDITSAASTDLEESESEDFKRKLEFPAATPNSSPFKRPKPLESKYYGPNSPLKLEEENIKLTIKRGSPLRRTPQRILGPSYENTTFSPSPLVRRPLTKSLLELAKEHDAILQEFKNDDKTGIFSQDAEDSSSDAQNDDKDVEAANGKKPKRRRILRRLASMEEGKVVPRDISKELLKLKRQQVNDFLGKEVIEEADEEDKSLSKTSETTKNQSATNNSQPKKRKSKYNLVSNNFKRLKLPRKHSGNRRWQRRR